MEDAFIVDGGIPLKGEVQLSGAKNVALKVAIASLLFDGPVKFSNIPKIKDVEELLHILKSIGAKVLFEGNQLTIDPDSVNKSQIDLLHASKTRVSFMLFAPFLKRFGIAYIPNPGGCRIGARPINRQIEMMKAFGISVIYDSSTGYYEAKYKKTASGSVTYRFSKPTHTGTELAILFGLIDKRITTIQNAALEPEIDDLINFLNQSGAKINKKNTTIIINGGQQLKQADTGYQIMYDRNEAPTYAVFALATKGDIIVKGADKINLEHFLSKVNQAGGNYEIVSSGIRFYYQGSLKSTSVTTMPHPGFMTDWQSPWAVLMTQTLGTSIIHETVFENRFGYVSELKKLGAKIEFFSPSVDNPQQTYQFDIKEGEINNRHQAIRIYGPIKLHGGVVSVSDMRAGASLLIAACMAKGQSVVLGASEVDRGYETIEKKLRLLGARIKRV